MARASVSFRTKMPSANGSGLAYQSWNADHASATSIRAVATGPVGFRPPVSDSATICCSLSRSMPSLLRLIAVLPLQRFRDRYGGDVPPRPARKSNRPGFLPACLSSRLE